MTPMTNSTAWQALKQHCQKIAPLHLRELLASDPKRFDQLKLQLSSGNGNLLIDISKQRLTPETLVLLRQLAEERNWTDWRERFERGETINHTEGRAVAHHWLRAGESAPVEVRDTLARIANFCECVHSGQWRGFSGEHITDVVNLGIGGSDLGPRMAVQALQAFQHPDLRVHFVANLDSADLASTLAELNPRTTLFIVASKTFSTLETLTNAHTARQWLLHAAADENAIAKHFVAASTNLAATREFGIAAENVFPFSDWVGGRFSLWSSIGLSIALAVGFDHFSQLLAGAQAMDEHFFTADAENNLPLTLALLTVWNRNFLDIRSHGIFPYSHSLRLLPAHLQQLEMESNGKQIDREGLAVNYPTNPILWGEAGTNGQHSFFQLLHQGGETVASDFIALAQPDLPLPGHHTGLLANCLAQSAALALGQTMEEARAAGVSEALVPYRTFPGNQPSTTILLPALTPYSLGQLIALYEHKVFCLGVLWNLNAFDQWGVELGKQLAQRLTPILRGEASAEALDASSRGLIAHLEHLAKVQQGNC